MKHVKVTRQGWMWILFVFLALTLLNCNTVMGTLDNRYPSTMEGVDRETSIILMAGQPRTLDPALTHGGPDSPIGHIFSGLVTLDSSLRVQPDLAAGWEIADNGTLYTFYLHQNAVFHDGRPVTAQDVIFSWERAATPDTGSDTVQTYLGDIVGVHEMLQGEADHISGIRALDDHTLQVRIDAPKVYFLAKLSYPVAFVVDRNNVQQADWEHNPNGTGPFKLQVWEDDRLMMLARHDAYYREPAYVPYLVYRMDAGLFLSRYEKGEIDIVTIGGSNLERVQDPNNPLFDELVTGVSMCTSYVGFNSNLPPFDDPLVRQAFSYALDRERLVNGLLQGNALPATGPLPPGMPGYQQRDPSYPYDLEKAQALLAEAGYTAQSLPTVTYTTSGYGDVSAFVAAVITMWQENLGVTIIPSVLDPFIYYEELYGGNAGHLYSSGWCADYPDPENFLDVLYHSRSPQNIGQFSDPGIDALLEEARTESDVTRRLALYAAIESQIIEAAPSVFISHNLSAALVKPYLEGYALAPIGVAQWHRVRVTR